MPTILDSTWRVLPQRMPAATLPLQECIGNREGFLTWKQVAERHGGSVDVLKIDIEVWGWGVGSVMWRAARWCQWQCRWQRSRAEGQRSCSAYRAAETQWRHSSLVGGRTPALWPGCEHKGKG